MLSFTSTAADCAAAPDAEIAAFSSCAFVAAIAPANASREAAKSPSNWAARPISIRNATREFPSLVQAPKVARYPVLRPSRSGASVVRSIPA